MTKSVFSPQKGYFLGKDLWKGGIYKIQEQAYVFILVQECGDQGFAFKIVKYIQSNSC